MINRDEVVKQPPFSLMRAYATCVLFCKISFRISQRFLVSRWRFNDGSV